MENKPTINSLSDLLVSSKNENVIQTEVVSDATVAMPKMSLVQDIALDHELDRQGPQSVAVGEAGSGLAQARAFAAASCPFADQHELGLRFRSEAQVTRAIAQVIGVTATASARIQKTTLVVTRFYAKQMGAILANGLDPLAESIATSVFADIFNKLGYYHDDLTVEMFFPPIEIEGQLLDPFTTGLRLDALQKSPFQDLDLSNELLSRAENGSAPYMALVSLAQYICKACDAFVTRFNIIAEEQEQAAVGLQVIADAIHGRVQYPFGWVSHEAIKVLRKNITFHELTLDVSKGAGKEWTAATQARIEQLVRATKQLSASDAGDIVARQAAVDMEESSPFKLCLDAALKMINAYVDFVPLSFFHGLTNIQQIESIDDNNMLNALVMTMNYERVKSLDVYAGYSAPERNGSPLITGSVTNHAGSIEVPTIETNQVVSALAEIFGNFTVQEAVRMIDTIVEGEDDDGDSITIDAGGYLSVVPGSPVALITNMHNLELGSMIEFEDTRYSDGKAEMPYLVRLCAAARAHKVIFTPGDYLRYVRHAEPGYPLRQAGAQVTDTAVLSRDVLETMNPLDILIAARLPATNASITFKVNNPVIELGKLISKEFVAGDEIVEFRIKGLPALMRDRKAALGRTDNEFPSFTYTRREARGPDGSREEVKSLIDISPYFSNQHRLFVSRVRCHVTLEQEIEGVLNAVEDLRKLGDAGKLHAARRLGDLIKALCTRYMRTGVRATDVVGLDANPTIVELKEFMLYSGLHISKEIFKHTQLVDEAVMDRVISSVRDLTENEFRAVIEHAVAIAAKRV